MQQSERDRVGASEIGDHIADRAAGFHGGRGMVLLLQERFRIRVYFFNGVPRCSWIYTNEQLSLDRVAQTVQDGPPAEFALREREMASLAMALRRRFSQCDTSVQPLWHLDPSAWDYAVMKSLHEHDVGIRISFGGQGMNTRARFAVSDLLLWPLCGLVWWSWAHMMTVFIPGKLWLAGRPAIIAGALLGLLAYVRFVLDIRDGLPLNIAHVRVNMLVLILGAVAGGILGWMYAMGNTTGPASVLPGYRFPPTAEARFTNVAVCGVFGLLASSGMMFLLGKLGRRRWVLLACLLGALALLYVVVPFLFLQMAGGT